MFINWFCRRPAKFTTIFSYYLCKKICRKLYCRTFRYSKYDFFKFWNRKLNFWSFCFLKSRMIYPLIFAWFPLNMHLSITRHCFFEEKPNLPMFFCIVKLQNFPIFIETFVVFNREFLTTFPSQKMCVKWPSWLMSWSSFLIAHKF